MPLKLENEQLSEDFFYSVLKTLHENNALEHLTLIGSWVNVIYREAFGNPDDFPLIRTLDLDFHVQKPVKGKIDLSSILENLGFLRLTHEDGAVKFEHEELEVEFLSSMGRSKKTIEDIPEMNISVQTFQSFNTIYSNSKIYTYKNIPVRCPTPAYFIYAKLYTSTKRSLAFLHKAKKDVETSKALAGYFLENHPEMIPEFQEKISDFGSKNKKVILSIIKKHIPELFKLLN